MNEYEAKLMLKKYGVKVPNGYVAKTKDDLKNMNLKYPLVAKVLSDKILHKSDVGGVLLHIKTLEEAQEAFEKINGKFSTPVLFEEMVNGNVETIIGVIKDPTFGHAIMFGLGGIYTEVYRDVTFRVIPINRRDAEDMIQDIRGKKILEGYRGKKVNREAIISLLTSISKLVVENPDIEGIDLNPVLLTEDKAIVLDAKIIKS